MKKSEKSKTKKSKKTNEKTKMKKKKTILKKSKNVFSKISSHIASTKEAVADDTANSNTNITSCVNQTTLSDFSKNMKEPSPTENEEEIDDQTSSMESHEIQCEKEYWSDLRADTGTSFLPGKIVMEPHSLVHFPSQPWSKETKSFRFEESVGDSTNDQNSVNRPSQHDGYQEKAQQCR